MRRLLHAAGVQVAARRGHSDQTGGKGQQQSMAHPVQRQRQELTGLRRVLATPGDSEMHECEDGRQRVRSQQREVSVLLLASSQSETGSKASSVGTWYDRQPRAPTLIRMVTTPAEFYPGRHRARARAVWWEEINSLLC